MDNIQAVNQTSFSAKLTQLLQKYPIILQILRFGAIGVFNTAIDALVLNFMAAQFGISKGAGLSWVNLPGFVLAVIQSYYWNKYWAFSGEFVYLLKNFIRLVAVGVVGVVTFGLIFLGGHTASGPLYFISIFGLFVLSQVILWYSFGFFKAQLKNESRDYVSFFIVSLIGFFINSLVLYFATTHSNLTTNSGDNLNIAKLMATAVSLVWNFIGYKIFVFKK